MTTGCNATNEGMDVEGEAVRARDENKLQRLAQKYASNTVGTPIREGAFGHEGPGDGGGEAHVYEVTPSSAFGKGEPFSQTRWRC